MRRVQRLARLAVGRNQLRRPYDRFEGAILLTLSAAFLAAVVGASFFGAHIYQSQRAGVARLRPAAAILTQAGPPGSSGLPSARQALARWPVPGGREKSGLLTTLTAPDIPGAAAGTRVPVWLNRLGQPVNPPPGQALMIVNAVLMATAAALGAAVGLLIPYWLCRLSLDRRRLAAWESAWALTGPRWTSRR
jgi:hypothetical protein